MQQEAGCKTGPRNTRSQPNTTGWSRYRLVYRCKYIAIGTKYKDIYRYIYGDDVWTRSERTPEDVISTVRPLLLRDLRRVEKQEKGREREEDKERKTTR